MKEPKMKLEITDNFENYRSLDFSNVAKIIAQDIDKKILNLFKNHRCSRPDSCRCSSSALEPNEDCPIHGQGEWPPRCKICGRFMKYSDLKDSEL